MRSLLITTSLLALGSSVFGQLDIPKPTAKSDLQPAETLGYSSGLGHSLHSLAPVVSGGLHSLTPTVGALHGYGSALHSGGLGGLGHSSYDDLHKYGGIGKKVHTGSLYDHGSKGYKDYYGDASYGNQGLNKYSNHHSSDHVGGKSGSHANYHNGHVYSRNRGYGYEKHYMYDKEYSTSNKGGSKGGHHSYYGDHKKGGQSSVKAYKNYGGKKFGAKKGHDDHAYGKYSHLMDSHGDHYLKKPFGMPHLEHVAVAPETYVTQHEYVPVIESYGGALGHGALSGGHMPVYNDHSGSDGLLEYDTQSSPSYVPSASSTEPETSPVLVTPAKVTPTNPPAGSNNAPLISTKLVTPTSATAAAVPPPVYATIGDLSPRVNSAVHATPAVISTSTGAHYYNN